MDSKTTNTIIQTRHAAYNTPTSTVSEWVKQATNQHPTNLEKIVKGYDNEVYAVETEPGQAFIVRISRHGKTGFKEEMWAMDQCRAVGVPVPAIIWFDLVELESMTQAVMIQQKLSGRPLSDLLATFSEAELAHVLYQVGEVLSRIHSITVDGFYKMQEGGVWDFPTWEAITSAEQRDRASERPYLIQAGFTHDDVDQMLQLLQRSAHEFPCHQPILCHGDYLPDHIFIDDDMAISGIIDFGEFQGGSPMLDIAHLSFEHPELDLDLLQAGYMDKSLFDDLFETRLRLSRLGSLMGYLAHYVKISNVEEIAPAANQLRATLDALRL